MSAACPSEVFPFRLAFLCLFPQMLIRRGDEHGLDGNDKEWSAGGGWEVVDPARIRQEFLLWTLECHRHLDADCRPVAVRWLLLTVAVGGLCCCFAITRSARVRESLRAVGCLL